MHPSLPDRLRAARRLRGWSQTDLARGCGWDAPARIGNYEQGTRTPSHEDIERMANALWVCPIWLQTGRLVEDPARAAVIREDVVVVRQYLAGHPRVGLKSPFYADQHQGEPAAVGPVVPGWTTWHPVLDWYSEKRHSPAVQAVIELATRGRRFGFQVVSTLNGRPEQERLRWAAMLLLEVGQVTPLYELPDVLPLGLPSSLRDDAECLLANSVPASK